MIEPDSDSQEDEEELVLQGCLLVDAPEWSVSASTVEYVAFIRGSL